MPVIVTSAGSPRWNAAPAAVFATIAVWLSSGTIGFRTPSGARIGVLPIAAIPLAIALVAGIGVVAAGRRGARAASIAVSPLALVVLPWLPFPLPPAFLIWTGALTLPIWIGVALALVSIGMRPGARGLGAVNHRIAAAVVMLAGCVVFGVAAWCASPSIPGGDEPHYLVITQSLLSDHDLNIENNHARGDYHAYFGGTLAPDFRARGRHGEIYSIHAPGVPVLVLPAFAIAGYHGVVVFLILVSACACTLAWWLAWQATGSVTAAWFGWAAVVFAAPFLLESFTVYPDGPGAAAVLTGFWALQRLDRGEPLGGRAVILHGAALAALPWMHTRFVLLAGVLGLLILIRLVRAGGAARAGAFLIVPIVSAAAWLASFYVMYGSANPSAPYGGESDSALAFLPNGIGGLLFDQGFGLLATAPVLVVPVIGLARVRRFAIEWGTTAVVYGAAVGAYAMWWAGSSGPARFLVPLILPLAIPAACVWHTTTSRGARAVMVTVLALSAWLAFVMAAGGGGLLGYHGRNVYGLTAAPWLGWANSLVDLPQALPAFVPLPQGTPLGGRIAAARTGFAAAVPWIACLAVAGFLVVRLGRRRDMSWPSIFASGTVACAAAAMIAASIVWWMHDAAALTPVPAQLDVVRRMSAGRTLTLDLARAHRIRNVSEMNMRIEIPVVPAEGSPATLATIPAVPAGSYGITFRGALRAPASVYAGQDDEPFRLIGGEPAFLNRLDVHLPVPVRALTVRAPSAAGVSGIELRPTVGAVFDTRVARHAARYGRVGVFFLDDRTAPEEDGFWIWGARDGVVLFQPMGTLDVTLRNGPVPNDVTIRAYNEEQHVTLQPGETRPVSLPRAFMEAAYAVTFRTSSGFRPADVDPRSQDQRFLGVYVVMPDHARR